jgi:hypothetical protein
VIVDRFRETQCSWFRLKVIQGNLHVLRILKTSKPLTIAAAAKEGPNLIVVAEERDEKLGASILKDGSEIAVAATFEELAS